ncbi:MAG: hypothetical protein GY832_01065 [Chloroflexi bacterium]|nr:hypothetical protein [Chloroflexota bacterium]
MNDKQVVDDLKAIRQVIDRTRQAAAGESGWFSVVGGMIWLFGFLGQQFLPEPLAGWAWVVVNTVGLSIIAWLMIRTARESSANPPMLRSMMLSWLALGIFDVLFLWLFEMETAYHFPLLILITMALGYVQVGLLSAYAPLIVVGIAIATFVVGAFLLVQPYFFLSVALLGGGSLIGTGLWMVRTGKRKGAS